MCHHLWSPCWSNASIGVIVKLVMNVIKGYSLLTLNNAMAPYNMSGYHLIIPGPRFFKVTIFLKVV